MLLYLKWIIYWHRQIKLDIPLSQWLRLWETFNVTCRVKEGEPGLQYISVVKLKEAISCSGQKPSNLYKLYWQKDWYRSNLHVLSSCLWTEQIHKMGLDQVVVRCWIGGWFKWLAVSREILPGAFPSSSSVAAVEHRVYVLRVDEREPWELGLVDVGDDQLIGRCELGLSACEELVEVLCSFATL